VSYEWTMLVVDSIIELVNTWRSGPSVGWILYEWTMLVVDSRRCLETKVLHSRGISSRI
jgi:hypothetical protein